MQKTDLSFFDEKRLMVKAETYWGCWWQTVAEVHIQVQLPEKTTSKQIQVTVKPKYIKVVVQDNLVFEGELPKTVHADEVIWTIEDGVLCIVLSKTGINLDDDLWESLLADGQYQPPALTLHEMRKNLDLERFQIENPGMDFSGAKLSKNYDRLPGWSNDRLNELKAKQEEEEKAKSTENQAGNND